MTVSFQSLFRLFLFPRHGAGCGKDASLMAPPSASEGASGGSRRTRRRIAATSIGFTLIELLAVIAIIGVLASLVLAGVSKVRKYAEAAKIQNQIRQIFLATSLYATDHAGCLPKVAATGISGDPAEFFFLMKENSVADLDNSGLNPYLGYNKANWFAPGDDGIKSDGTPGRNFSFSFNFLINKGELQPGASSPTGFEKALGTVRLPLLEKPTRKILFFEEDRPNDGFCVWFIDKPTTRHNGKAHAGFADGHVELLVPAEMSSSELCELVPQSQQY